MVGYNLQAGQNSFTAHVPYVAHAWYKASSIHYLLSDGGQKSNNIGIKVLSILNLKIVDPSRTLLLHSLSYGT